MKIQSILFYLLLVLAAATGVADEVVSPPRAWWKELVTIQSVEESNAKEINEFIKLMSSKPAKVYDENGEHQATPEESAAPIEAIKKKAITNNKQWKELKSLYQTGDEIYLYAAPPLSGPMGYLLVRKGKVIFNMVKAKQ